MKALFLVVIIAASSVHAAPLSATNLPPGAIPKYWAELTVRATWVRTAIETLAPNSKGNCIEAVAMDILGAMDVDWSLDAKGRGPGTRRKVVAGREDDFKKALNDNADKQCNDDDQDGDGKALQATVRGLLHFAEDVDEWTTSGQGDLKRGVISAAEQMAGMTMFGVPAVRQAATAPAGIPMPILPPSLFMSTESDSL